MLKEPYKKSSEDDVDFISFFTGLLKFAFWCMFLYYVGIFHVIRSLGLSDKERTESMRCDSIINSYLKIQGDVAEQKMKQYGKYPAMDYFTALHRMNWLEDSLNNRVVSFQFDRIRSAFDKSERDGLYTDDEFETAKNWCERQPRFHGTPKKSVPHVCNRFIHTWTIRTLPDWFWHVYRHMLPYAFLLMLLWVYQRKDKRTLSLRSPLSFLFLVCVHPVYMPIIIGRAWKESFRGFAASVELRRRKENIFERFSHEEREAIQAFARSAKSIKELTVWAAKFGERKHLAFIAIIAGIICSTGIQSEAQKISTHQSEIACIVQAHTGGIDIDVGYNAVSHDHDQGIQTLGWQTALIPILQPRNSKHYFMLLSQGYPQTREPVPIMF